MIHQAGLKGISNSSATVLGNHTIASVNEMAAAKNTALSAGNGKTRPGRALLADRRRNRR